MKGASTVAVGAPFAVRRYQLEHRESRERFLGTVVADAGAVAESLVGWARQRPGWDGGFEWTPVEVDPPQEVPALPREVREEV